MQIVVLGMHRSGTSALVRLLSLAGCWIGAEDDFHGADDANPRGYWEHKEVWGLDSDLLAALGGEWDEVPDFSLDALDSSDASDSLDSSDSSDASDATTRQGFETRARNLIARLDPHAPWAIKDPRLCLTLPFWRQFLTQPVAVFALRSPLSIARSISRRDGFPLAVGLALWELHLRAALTATRDLPRVAISFEDLLDRPDAELAQLVGRLRAIGVPLRDPDPTEVAAFLDRTLERERREPELEARLLHPEPLALRDALRDGSAFERGRDGGELSPLAADLLAHHAKSRRAWRARLQEIEAFHARVARDSETFAAEHAARLHLEQQYTIEHQARLDGEQEAARAIAAEREARLRAEEYARSLELERG